jgi:hypothetical protein
VTDEEVERELNALAELAWHECPLNDKAVSKTLWQEGFKEGLRVASRSVEYFGMASRTVLGWGKP